MDESMRRYLSAFYIPSLAVVVIVVGGGVYVERPVGTLFEDPAKADRLLGLVTYLGFLLWSAAAAICFFTSTVMRRAGGGDRSRFLVLGGGLSVALLFDDLFLFHEFVESHYKAVGENGVFLAYAVAIAAYLLYFRALVLRTDFIVLALALAFFSMSLAVDVIIGPWLWRLGQWAIVIEEVPKFLGIVGWLGYYARACHLWCMPVTRDGAKTVPAGPGSDG